MSSLAPPVRPIPEGGTAGWRSGFWGASTPTLWGSCTLTTWFTVSGATPATPLTNLKVVSADGGTTAEFAPDAGMVCCSFTHLGEELLHRGNGLDAYAQHGATMGIPLLYPWANRLDGFDYRAAGRAVRLPADRTRIPLDPNGLPIHGVIPGRMRWTPEEQGEPTMLIARLAWTSPELRELFPFSHELRIEAVVTGGTLTIATAVRPLEDEPVPVSFGYHPYLRLPGSRRESWSVQMPASERLVLDQRMIPTGGREPVAQTAFALADTSWDDGFAIGSQPARFAVTAPDREIAVELLEGFPFGQIYAPPEHDFICFEPMTAPTNALCSGEGLSLVAPGEEYRAVFRITTSRRR
jgi:aldose 1-epimerase